MVPHACVSPDTRASPGAFPMRTGPSLRTRLRLSEQRAFHLCVSWHAALSPVSVFGLYLEVAWSAGKGSYFPLSDSSYSVLPSERNPGSYSTCIESPKLCASRLVSFPFKGTCQKWDGRTGPSGVRIEIRNSLLPLNNPGAWGLSLLQVRKEAPKVE